MIFRNKFALAAIDCIDISMILALVRLDEWEAVCTRPEVKITRLGRADVDFFDH